MTMIDIFRIIVGNFWAKYSTFKNHETWFFLPWLDKFLNFCFFKNTYFKILQFIYSVFDFCFRYWMLKNNNFFAFWIWFFKKKFPRFTLTTIFLSISCILKDSSENRRILFYFNCFNLFLADFWKPKNQLLKFTWQYV